MTSTPNAERLHITFFGLRNAGKSSLVNAIAGRTVSIVSDKPGTTTDPVSRPMELGALGAVVLTDTAGLDDEGDLGALRVERSLERLSWTDIALLATPLHLAPTAVERETLKRLGGAGRKLVVVGTFADRPTHTEKEEWLASLEAEEGQARPRLIARTDSPSGRGVAELRKALADLGKAGMDGDAAPSNEDSPLEGLVAKGDLVVLVTPIDSAAPRGRLILPEAAPLRDALDRGCPTVVVREHELPALWPMLAVKPRLVVTDSQAFAEVVPHIPEGQALTSFSILFARKKGELAQFAPGIEFLLALDRDHEGAQDSEPVASRTEPSASRTEPSASQPEPSASQPEPKPLRVLSIEACTHNRTHEDIATIKIPAALGRKSGRRVKVTATRELSDNPPSEGYDLAVVCGGCMATRGRMLAQMEALAEVGLPVVNFGIFLAWANGAFPRVLEPEGLLDGRTDSRLGRLIEASRAASPLSL